MAQMNQQVLTNLDQMINELDTTNRESDADAS